MWRFPLALILAAMTAAPACANDLKEFYELALTRDAALQAAGFQRDAAVERMPQARSALLPQLSVNASATRERAGFDNTQARWSSWSLAPAPASE